VLSPAEPAPRELGSLAGVLSLPDDFDDPLAESDLALWEGTE